MSQEQIVFNPIVEQLKYRNAILNRTIDFVEDFTEESCYKALRLLDKIVELDNIAEEDPSEITIRINSYGGYCYELWSLIGRIEQLKKEGYTFKTIGLGKCMSCGFILLVAGDKRICSPYTSLLHHSVSAGTIGKIVEMEDGVKAAKRLNEMSRDYITQHTNIPKNLLNKIDKEQKDYIFSLKEIEKYNIAEIM